MLAALPAQAEAEVLLAALQRYFLGEPEDFRGIALDLNQGTTFQRSVWSAARAVPWGATATYGDLAAQLGRGPGSARAVGHALGQNPLHLLVPCHRFLAASGHLVDYAGGIEWKETLLRLEGHHLA
ncbi:MAG: methylated-DNA--[protein]-cysteine S-methyltransferase [Candidatus Hydrogenedentes bacterium]|nr:methylated-DNA--[protein]-cysteine S-methyltransferase [Candidatus Hydrogenedentota bacterium]